MTKYSCIYLYTGTQTSLHEITSSTHATNQTTFFLTNISTRSCRIYDVGLWKQPNTNTHTYWKHDLLVCKSWQTQEVRWGSSNNTLQCRGIKLVMMKQASQLTWTVCLVSTLSFTFVSSIITRRLIWVGCCCLAELPKQGVETNMPLKACEDEILHETMARITVIRVLSFGAHDPIRFSKVLLPPFKYKMFWIF